MSVSQQHALTSKTQDAPEEKPTTTDAKWAEYFRIDMQPTTALALMSIVMIFYARVVGG